VSDGSSRPPESAGFVGEQDSHLQSASSCVWVGQGETRRAEDDHVVDEHGAHVFLEQHAASYLDDKLLDTDIDGHQVRFVVGTQR
jgi:Fe-S cluster assembly iron-binding protein IscA